MKKYTDQEDAIIVECVQKNPTNLKEAFKHAAERLHKNYGAIASRYYSAIRKRAPIMFLATQKRLIPNAKNDVNDQQNIIAIGKKKEIVIELEDIKITITRD